MRATPPEGEARPGEGVTTTTLPARATTTRPRGATTSVLAQPGPLLGQLTGGSILVLADVGRWTWIDLDTGTRGEMDIRGVGDPHGAVPVAGGLVVVEESGQAALRRIPEGETQVLGEAVQVLSSGRPDRVWLLRWASSTNSTSAHLVDLTGREVLAFDVPVLWSDAGGRPDGLPFSAGGRSFFLDEDGVRPLADGELLGSVANGVVVLTCDDEAQCAPELVEPETGRAVRLGEPDTTTRGHVVVPGGQGDIAIVSFSNVASLAWYSPDGRFLGNLELPMLARRASSPGCRMTSASSCRPQVGSGEPASTAAGVCRWRPSRAWTRPTRTTCS